MLATFYQQQKTYNFCKKFIKGKNIMEIGCGSAYGTSKLASAAQSILAIDNDSTTIEDNKKRFKRDNISYVCKDIYKFVTKDKKEAVLSLQVIEHIKNPHIFLNKITKFLKTNGVVIISTPNGTTQSYNENPYHYKEYSESELKELLAPYFKKVVIYGVHGDSIIKKYEKMRRKHIMNVFKKDVFSVRKIIPLPIKQFLFDIATYLNRKKINIKNHEFQHVSEKNFMITRNAKNAIDLIAVCEGIQ
jgi:2-polyprenyl-3-methyl-5-hydroxy-6-metoxy-1,4-benzoquinol methylase